MSAVWQASPSRALARGLARRCPHCGQGRLFDGFFRLRQECGTCAYKIPDSTSDHAGIMYLTTAIQTAIFAFLVLLTHPPQPWLARGLLAIVAIGIMFADMPNRKGLAIALDYLADGPTFAPGVDRPTSEGPPSQR